MSRSDFLLVFLLILALAVAVGLYWLDIAEPRRQRRLERQRRKENRRRSDIRFRVWVALWNLRKTRRLTDQRLEPVQFED
jgi:hypothetical protein